MAVAFSQVKFLRFPTSTGAEVLAARGFPAASIPRRSRASGAGEPSPLASISAKVDGSTRRSCALTLPSPSLSRALCSAAKLVGRVCSWLAGGVSAACDLPGAGPARLRRLRKRGESSRSVSVDGLKESEAVGLEGLPVGEATSPRALEAAALEAGGAGALLEGFAELTDPVS